MLLRHAPTGLCGTLIKEYTPTGKPLTTMIRLENGTFYFAPSSEFYTV